MVSDRDFDLSDHYTLMDFTASTTALLVEQYHCNITDIEWYQFSSAATFVPFGSVSAYTQAPIDTILTYKGRIVYFELKGRRYVSTASFFKDQGSFCNPGKVANFELMRDGKIRFNYYKKDQNGEYILDERGKKIFERSVIYEIPIGKIAWGELYEDGVVRTWWDLVKIGLETLKPTGPEIMIDEVTIDPDTKKLNQKRGYLKLNDAMEYKRIKG